MGPFLRVLICLSGSVGLLPGGAGPVRAAVAPDAAGEVRARADRAFWEYRYADAVSLYRSLPDGSGNDGIVLYRLRRSLQNLPGTGPEEAALTARTLEALRRTVAGGPDPEASYYLGNLYGENDPRRGREFFRQRLEPILADPPAGLSPFASYRVALMSYYTDGPPEITLEWMRRTWAAGAGGWTAELFARDLVGLFFPVGEASDSLEEMEARLAEYEAAFPGSVTALLARAEFLIDAGEEEKAKAALEAAGTLGPQTVEESFSLAEQWNRVDRPDRAVALLEAILAGNPGFLNGWEELGISYYYQDRYEEAIEAFGRVLARLPNRWTSLRFTGHCLYEIDRDGEAERYFTRLTELDPGNQDVIGYLADAIYWQGRKEEALALLAPEALPGPIEERLALNRLFYLDTLDRHEAMLSEADAFLELYPDSAGLHRRRGRAIEFGRPAEERPEALRSYRRAVELDPGNRYARGDLIRLLWYMDEDGEARDRARQLVRDHPDYNYGWDLLVEILNYFGETRAEAVRVAAEALERFPEDAGLWRMKGLAHSNLGERDPAVEAFRRAVELEPGSVNHHHSLALELQLAERYDESRQALDRGLSLHPGAAILHFRRGVVLDMTEDREGAEASLREAIRLDPDLATAYNSLAVVLANTDRAEEALAMYVRALELRPGFVNAEWGRAALLFRLERNAEALEAYERLMEEYPGKPLYPLRRAILLRRMKRLGDAELAFRRAAETPGAGGEAWLGLGDLYRDSDRPAEALAAYEKAAVHPGQQRDSVIRRAQILSRQERHLEGYRLVASWMGPEGEDPWGYRTLAIFLRDLGLYEEARRYANLLLERLPGAFDSYWILADVERYSGDFEAAAGLYRKMVELEPDRREIWETLGRCHGETGNRAAAIEAYGRALALKETPLVRRRLAELEEEQGNLRAARKHWKEAERRHPGNAGILQAAAGFHHRRGDDARAIALLERAAVLSPGSPGIRRELGVLLAAAGRERRAEEALRAALRLDPKDEEARRALLSNPARREETESFLAGLRLQPVDLMPITAEEALAEFDPTAALYDDQIAADVLDSMEMEVLADGRTRTTWHTMRAVLDESAIEMLGEVRIPFNPEDDVLVVHAARTHLPDGTVIEAGEDSYHLVSPADTETSNLYRDTRIRVISMPSVQRGAVVEWRYTIEEGTSLFGRNWWRMWQFDGPVPTSLSRMVLKVPEGMGFRSRRYGRRIREAVRDGDGGRVFAWTAEHLPAVPGEPNARPIFDRSNRVQITSFDSWDEIGAWYDRLARNRYLADAGIRSRVEELVAAAGSTEEKARRITEYVRDTIRYAGIEFGIGSYQPRRSTEVFRTRFGDCKDQTTLLIAMLRQAGIAAHPVLVRSGSKIALDEWLPSPGLFDHTVAYLPDLRGGLFVDTTVPFMDFGDVPPVLQGGEGLLVTPGRGKPVRIPLLAPERNLLRGRRTIDLTDPGLARIRDRSSVTGIFATAARSRYGAAGREERGRRLEEDVLSEFPQARNLSMEVAGVGGPAVAISGSGGPGAVVVQEFEVPEPLTAMDDGRFLWVLSLGGDSPSDLIELSPVESRLTEYLIPFLFVVEEGISVRVPAGWRLESVPEPVEVSGYPGEFSRVVRETAGGFEIESRFRISRDWIPVDQYGNLAALVRSAARHHRTPVVLVAPPDPD